MRPRVQTTIEHAITSNRPRHKTTHTRRGRTTGHEGAKEMTDKPRVRKRFPKMPDVKITDMLENPPPEQQTRPQAASRRGSSSLREDPLSIRYHGKITAAIPLWRTNADGYPAKYYDTRVRYENDDGAQFLQIMIPADEYAPVGSTVEVEERAGKVRVTTRPRQNRDVRGFSWSKPDIKTAGIVLGVILAIVLAIALIGWVISKGKKGDSPNTVPTPTIVLQTDDLNPPGLSAPPPAN